jgi:transcriptional regulator with XRE-family HTH domain
MRVARKKVAMTQHELAVKLGVSRKTIVGWERSAGPLDEGVALQVFNVTRQIRLIENSYRVDQTRAGTYAVVGRRIRNVPHPNAMAWFHSELMLFGEFKRRDHAYRWRATLEATADPRGTRKLIMQRAEDVERAREAGTLA